MADIKRLEEKILDKIEIIVDGITSYSSTELDLVRSETVEHLANAYVQLKLFEESEDENNG